MAQYYSGDRLLRYKVPYRLIIGERSNGKTYFVKKYCFEHYINTGRKFVYLRKRKDSISRKEMKKLWADLNEDIILDELHDTLKYTPDSGFYYDNDDGERITLGYALSLEDYESKKGIPYNDVDIIFFDEFIEQRGDLLDEWKSFINLISTIRRKRDNVEIFLVANTITKYSTYFENFGIDIKRLRQGQIVYVKHELGVELAIEYCRSLNKIAGKGIIDKYFGFDNSPASKMIMYGEWDYDIVNIREVDGIGWKNRRKLIPLYLTALGEVYEFSEYVNKNPIIFIRKVNTQNGVVKPYIRYNICYDNSMKLVTNNNGKMMIVPTYAVVNELLGEDIVNFWKLLLLCIDAKRVVFDNLSTGSDFLRVVKDMK